MRLSRLWVMFPNQQLYFCWARVWLASGRYAAANENVGAGRRFHWRLAHLVAKNNLVVITPELHVRYLPVA